MPTINPLLSNTSSGINTETTPDGLDEAQAAQGGLPLGTVAPSTGVSGAGASSFQAIKPTSASNVLTSAPPAEGGGRTDPINVAEAIGRMRQLQMGVHPVVQALVRSSEDGTAPAVPSKTATIGAGSSATTASATATSTDDSSTAATSDVSNGMSAVSQTINTDLSGASDDVLTAGSTLETDASKTSKNACNKNPGEKQLNHDLKGMGLSKDQASKISKILNDSNSDVPRTQGEVTLIAASIATYNKLGENDPKHTSTASKQILTNLKIAANNYDASTTKKAAIYDKGDSMQAEIKSTSDASGMSGSGTANGAYTTAMNALQSYVVEGSNNSALKALTTPVATASATQPYNWYGQ